LKYIYEKAERRLKKKTKVKTGKPKKHSGRPTNPIAREKLLDVALKLFSEKGYDAVSIREIARAAKVNAANISYHFGGKLGLYKEIVSLQLEDRKKIFAEIIASNKHSPKDKVICRIKKLSKVAASNREFKNLIFRALLSETDKKVKCIIRDQYLPPLCESLLDLLKDCKISSKYSFMTPHRIAMFSLSVRYFWFLFADDFKKACPIADSGDEIREEANQFVIDLLNEILE